MNIHQLTLKLRKERAAILKKKRKESGLTQQGLSNISGIRKATICCMERGEVGWTIDSENLYLNAIENFLNNNL